MRVGSGAFTRVRVALDTQSNPHKDSAMTTRIQDKKSQPDLSERGTGYHPSNDAATPDKTQSVPSGVRPDLAHPGPDGQGGDDGGVGKSI